MRITVSGATGLVGRHLVAKALARGDEVVARSRSTATARSLLGEEVELHEWRDPQHEPAPPIALQGADAVIHLLGEPVAQRWSSSAKQEIRDSRVLSTQQLVAGLAGLTVQRRPSVLVSGSATGFYGPRGEEPVDERDQPGHDFLADVVVAWEAQARAATGLGLRVAHSRTGVVLASGEGALAKMLPPFRLGVGGPVAGGRQYVPWIHLDDMAGALLHCAGQNAAAGPVNLTAPNPVTNAELSRVLGRVLHRPAVLPVPGAAVKLLYGEMASIVTGGQRAVPTRLQELGYNFIHPELQPALQDVLGSSGG